MALGWAYLSRARALFRADAPFRAGPPAQALYFLVLAAARAPSLPAALSERPQAHDGA